MGSAAAQIPTSFGHELRACLRCRLVKTYDQVFFFVSALLSLLPVLFFFSVVALKVFGLLFVGKKNNNYCAVQRVGMRELFLF